MAPLILLTIGSVIAWGAWGFVLVKFDPFINGSLIHLLFYASLSMALLGTLTLIGLFWHKKRVGMPASRGEVGALTRQILLFIIFIVVMLNLAAANLLKWWNLIPLALAVFTVELLFTSLQKHNRTR